VHPTTFIMLYFTLPEGCSGPTQLPLSAINHFPESLLAELPVAGQFEGGAGGSDGKAACADASKSKSSSSIVGVVPIPQQFAALWPAVAAAYTHKGLPAEALESLLQGVEGKEALLQRYQDIEVALDYFK
jgi:hypothetical protein